MSYTISAANPEISIEDALEGGRVHLQFRRSFNSADIGIMEELIERLSTVQLADGQDKTVLWTRLWAASIGVAPNKASAQAVANRLLAV